jgi:hypothetical protein
LKKRYTPILLSILLLIVLPFYSKSQGSSFSITIQLVDSFNLEPIAGITIFCNQMNQISDGDGMVAFKISNKFLDIKILNGPSVLLTQQLKVNRDTFLTLKLNLMKNIRSFNPVLITTKRSLLINKNSFSIGKVFLQNITVPLSTQDPVQLLKFFPGITTSQEMNANINIRGGTANNTRFYLDHIPVPNITHSFGLFSFFDMQTLRGVDYFNQNISGEYGNRGGSYIKFHAKDPELNQRKASFFINPFLVSGGYNGQVIKDKLGVFVHYRKSIYNEGIDFLLPIFSNFQDILIKTKYHINDRSFLSATIVDSYDKINQEIGLGLDLSDTNYNRFSTYSLAYNLFSNKNIKHEITAFFSKHTNEYQSKIFGAGNLGNVLNDYNLKYNRTDYKDRSILKKTGAELQYIENQNIFLNNQAESLFILAAYSDLSKIIKKWNFYSNVRLNYIGSLQEIKPEIRSGIAFTATKNRFFVEYNQFINVFHTVSNNIIPINSDYLFLSDQQFKPQEISESLVGFKRESKKIDIGITAYSRVYKNSFDYIDLNFASLYNKSNLAALNHQSYGVENYINYSFNEKHSLFTNYTYSKAIVQSDLINLGMAYNANFDRPHVLNSIYTFKMKKLIFTSTFTLQSGRPLSIPLFYLPNNIIAFSDRNEYRLPLFHKLDIGMKYRFGKKVKQTFDLHIYNVYARRNVFAILYAQDEDTFEYAFRYLSFFPFLPTFSYGIEL